MIVFFSVAKIIFQTGWYEGNYPEGIIADTKDIVMAGQNQK